MKRIFIAFFAVILFASGVQNAQSSTIKKELFLTTTDCTKIAINHYKTGHNEVVIMAPGWFMSKDSKPFKHMAEDFSQNYDVIALDFRGHCKSSGTFTFTAREPEDLRTVVCYAKNQYKKVYLIGFSLGGATAVIHTANCKNIDKLILVSAPVSFDKIENEMWKKEAFIPTLQKCELSRWVSVRPGKFWLKKISPIDVIQTISPTPILIIAGEKDPTVHPWHAKALYDKAKEPKKLIIIKDGIHAEDLYLKDPKNFVNTCTQWIKTN